MTEPRPYFDDGQVSLYVGDCLDVLAGLPDSSIDSIVTDPPYGLAELSAATVLTAIAAWMSGDRIHVPDGRGFMGREWDSFVPPPGVWDECLRVLKPGGHLLSFAGSRTVDLMTLSIRIAGFEIRDGIDWIYGSGFPKSLDVSKAIDRRRTDEIGHVCRFLHAAIEAGGIPRKAIGEHMGINPRGVDLWAPGPTDKSAQARAHVPTWEQWARLRELLGFGDDLDAEVWRLNGRKGTPGEAWGEREVTQQGSGRQRPGEVIGWDQRSSRQRERRDTPTTEDAVRWEGWGTALKPAHEPIVVARKPLAGTVAANVLEHGTGALNVSACRVGTDARVNNAGGTSSLQRVSRVEQGYRPTVTASRNEDSAVDGRWPPNVLLSEDAAAELDAQSGNVKAGGSAHGTTPRSGTTGAGIGPGGIPMERTRNFDGYGDSGGASRFFPVFRYEAKAPASERPRLPDGTAHPTVKPLDLMRWLVRLVTPPGGTVGDFFAGSGTTGEACLIEGFNCILAEKDPASADLIKARLSKPIQPVMFGEAG